MDGRLDTAKNESSSRSPAAATQRLATLILALLTATACGGGVPDTDPLASIAEAVSEDMRSTPNLAEAWRRMPETPLTYSPAVGTRTVYLALGSRLAAWDVSNGESRWAPIDLDSDISAAPVALGQEVIVASRGNADTPARIWWFASDGTMVSQTPVSDAVTEISAVPATVLYIDSRGVGRLGGGVEWHTPLDDPVSVELAADHGLALVTTAAGKLLAFDVISGSVRWEYDAGGPITRARVVGDRVYVGGGDLGVFALRSANGRKIWNRALGTAVLGAPGHAQDILWVGALDSKLHAIKASNGTEIVELLVDLSSRNYLDIASFEPWVVVGAHYGPWLAVRGPTRDDQVQAPTRVTVQQSTLEGRPDLSIPPGSGPAGVAVVNGDGTVIFLQPRRAR